MQAKLTWLVLLAVSLSAPARSQAGTITGLYNTGVDNSDNVLPNNSTTVDSHYAIVVNPDLPPNGGADGSTHVEDSGSFPIVTGPWLADTAHAQWIAPEFNTSNAAGPNSPYDYQLTFNIDPTVNLSLVSVYGGWAVDNTGDNILINGQPTGITSGGFSSLTPFTISSGFVSGPNTLDFLVTNNGAGYTGLYVTGLHAIPEPSSVVLLGLGAVGLVVGVRRKRSQ